MARTTESLSFAVSADDRARIQQLAKRYAGGERSRLLRIMLDRMDAYARAEELSALQTYGVKAANRAGMADADVHEVVRRRLGSGPSPRAQRLVERAASDGSAATPAARARSRR